MCVPAIVARQQPGKKCYYGNEHTCNNRIVGCAVFYAFRVIWNEIRLLVLLRTPCFYKYLVYSIFPLNSEFLSSLQGGLTSGLSPLLLGLTKRGRDGHSELPHTAHVSVG
jgi:hypothetical protein